MFLKNKTNFKMIFDLMPYDDDIWQVAADYAEENGCLLPKAIRDKILPLDIEEGDGKGFGIIYWGFYTSNAVVDNVTLLFNRFGGGYGNGNGDGNGRGEYYTSGVGFGCGDGSGSSFEDE